MVDFVSMGARVMVVSVDVSTNFAVTPHVLSFRFSANSRQGVGS